MLNLMNVKYLMIPLEPQSRGDKAMVVEVFYSGRAGAAGSRTLDLELLTPKFDLPLENIVWRVSLSDKWRVEKWSGALQLQQQELTSSAGGPARRASTGDRKSMTGRTLPEAAKLKSRRWPPGCGHI